MPQKPLLQNLAYGTVLFALISVSLFSAYYIAVNTVLSTRVLPRVFVQNVDVSLLTQQDLTTKLDSQVLNILPQNMHVKIDEYEYDVSTTELGIKADTSPLKYGKGSNMLKVAEEAIGLIKGQNLQLSYTLDPQAIIDHLPINIKGTNPARIENGIVKNCAGGEFSIDFNRTKLGELAKQALSTDTPLQAALSDVVSVPQTVDLVHYCARYNTQSQALKSGLSTIGLDITAVDLRTSDDKQGTWQIANDEALRQRLADHAATTNVAADEGQYEVRSGKVLLFKQYQTGRNLNIDQSVVEIQNWINNPVDALPLVYDEVQPRVLSLGMPISDFTKHLASGKTRIDIIRDNHPNWVLPYAQYGLEEVQNLIIDSHTQFSFIDTINPQPGGWTQEGRPIGAGICNSSTTLFRAALESGFPITDRSPHPTYIASYEWGYAMNLVDAAYLTEPRVDMKFVNDLDYPILLKFSYARPGDGWQYHTLDVYTSSKAPERKVVIDNFKKWNVQSATVYEGSFDRKVYEGDKLIRSDNFYSKYANGGH